MKEENEEFENEVFMDYDLPYIKDLYENCTHVVTNIHNYNYFSLDCVHTKLKEIFEDQKVKYSEHERFTSLLKVLEYCFDKIEKQLVKIKR